MKKLLATLLFAATLSQATVIHWYRTNDSQGYSDMTAADGVYTGIVTDVELNDGTLSGSDALVGYFTIIDVNLNKFMITTSANAVVAPSSILFSGDFDFDITAGTIDPGVGAGIYTLKNLAVSNTVGSTALDEFADAIATYGTDARYNFSMIGAVGNGQVATVPEPTTLGLMGLGLLGLGAAGFRRRRKA